MVTTTSATLGASSVIKVTDTSAKPGPPGQWLAATVRDVQRWPGYGVRLRFDVPGRKPHLPGQHYVIRLVAPNGYSAQRSYSLASDPADPDIELFVERLEEGEVSPYLADEVEVGDQLSVRGPIGGWFTWTGEASILGLAGGSGVVPFVSMLRHAAAQGRSDLIGLAVSARSIDRLPYADELHSAGALIALTREPSPAGRPQGRLSATELMPLVAGRESFYVCGSNSFAESMSQTLVSVGAPMAQIRVERFGPSG
jgi:ferredoxin-NADP reductase